MSPVTATDLSGSVVVGACVVVAAVVVVVGAVVVGASVPALHAVAMRVTAAKSDAIVRGVDTGRDGTRAGAYCLGAGGWRLMTVDSFLVYSRRFLRISPLPGSNREP